MIKKKTFLSAHWQDLIMANYAVDAALLQPYLPLHTELDVHQDIAYVSLVGFLFADTRLRGLAIPFHVNFPEVNLRFYVRYKESGVWKRGTVFIKEIVPRRAIAFVANTFYNEKYITLPMRRQRIQQDDHVHLNYKWKFQNRWNMIAANVKEELSPLGNETVESFIAEHYWGYSKYNTATTYEYEVVHPPWQQYAVMNYTIDCDFGGLYGEEFAFLEHTKPASVLVAKGSPIQVMGKKIL